MCFFFYADYKILENKDCAILIYQHDALEAEMFGKDRTAINIFLGLQKKEILGSQNYVF